MVLFTLLPLLLGIFFPFDWFFLSCLPPHFLLVNEAMRGSLTSSKLRLYYSTNGHEWQVTKWMSHLCTTWSVFERTAKLVSSDDFLLKNCFLVLVLNSASEYHFMMIHHVFISCHIINVQFASVKKYCNFSFISSSF